MKYEWKECKNTISVALTDVFNKSIAAGDVLYLVCGERRTLFQPLRRTIKA